VARHINEDRMYEIALPEIKRMATEFASLVGSEVYTRPGVSDAVADIYIAGMLRGFQYVEDAPLYITDDDTEDEEG
jgi:hypothetical protein